MEPRTGIVTNSINAVVAAIAVASGGSLAANAAKAAVKIGTGLVYPLC